MPRKNNGVDASVKFTLVVIIFSLITLGTVLYYHYKNNNEIAIEYLDAGEGISSPHLNGSVVIEVDYMEHNDITQSQLDEISEVFTDYGVNVTLVLDDEVPYQSSMDNTDVATYYENYRDEDYDSYILIGSKYSVNTDVLGAIYNAEKIVIYKDKIDNSFDGAYREMALYYVILHEIGHAYGCNHSDDVQDIMYPYLSQGKIVLYPDPEFTDANSVYELQN